METINITGIKHSNYPSTRLLQAILTTRRSTQSQNPSKTPSKSSFPKSKCDISIISLSRNTDQHYRPPDTHKRFNSLLHHPNISASSWCVLDCNSSHWLAGHNDCELREIASLSKILTCLVCLRFLDSNDCISLYSKVKVSFKAAQMIGTTANLRAGDYLSLKSLLFGLMLPSGNDAAWALAEYIGAQISPNSVKPVKHFVLEMNKLVRELRLIGNSFENPHGLMCKRNLSCARDVAKLTCFAMKNKRFREIVDTKEYTAEIVGLDGVGRMQMWDNTNRLLGGLFCGVKTGITDAAGPCLAVCSRNISPIVIVLLNCRTMEDRWVEAKKLLDWVGGKG